MTAGLGSEVLMQFATIKPVFEELEKVKIWMNKITKTLEKLWNMKSAM